jgi:hypothetical protein
MLQNLLAVRMFVFLLAAAASMLGQTTTATLFGVVRDATGALIPQARIAARNISTAFERVAASDATGAYLITNLPVGQYSLLVEKDGFRRFIQNGVTLTVNENARVDAVLSLGQVNESITVTAEATGVDTRSSAMGEVVDRIRVQELPLKGRNVMELARVVPGVIRVSAPPVVTQARQGPQVTVAGGRDTENEFRFDGASHKNLTHNSPLNLPSPDALQEFKVLTSNTSAEYGRYGGGVFVAVTRGGSNQLHGSLWEYLRNKALNSRNFFAADKPDLKLNEFGFTLGGPVVRNRTFFFGSYQGLRQRESQLFATARPPTALERSGDFSASAQRPNDPLNGNAPFPNGRIPSNRFDVVAGRLLERYIPLPNQPDGRWVELVARPTDGDQYLIRGDHNFGPNNSLNVRYFRDESGLVSQSGNIVPYSPARQSLRVTNWALADTHTFSPALLNEFRIGVMRADSLVTILERTQLSDLGANYPGVITPQLPNINVTGYFNLGSTDSFSEHPNIYSAGNTLRWFRGKHSLSFGGEFERTEMFNRGSSANQGTFSFDASVTRNAFADFLIGLPVSLDQASPYERLVKGWDVYGFVQDDFRMSSRLTLNLGLRYGLFHPYRAVYDRTNTYIAGQKSTVVPTAPLGMIFPGDAGVGRGLVPTDTNNFAPRVGLAWDPKGDGKFAVRTSYGLYHEDFRSDLWTYPAVNQPFVIRELVQRPYSLTDPYRGRVNPFPYIYSPQAAKFSYPMGLFTVLAPTLPSPYVHHLSLSLERAIPGNTVVKASYVGKLAHNLLRMTQQNPAAYVPGASTVANTDQRRILMPGTYGSFRLIETNSNAAYHSLQLLVNKRFSHGFTVLGAYTLGKMLDYYSAMNLGQTPQDPFNHRADRGHSDEDRRHILNVSFVYDLPVLRQQKGALGKAFGGWRLSGMVRLSSGSPIHVRSGQDLSLSGVGWDRPDLVGDPVREHSSRDDMILRFFNTSAFVPNQTGRFGNAARNLIFGPAQSTTDLSLVKSFPISERLGSLQFRAEFYNAWNQVSFGSPNATLNNRLFGQIQSAADPRIVQLALRYQF